MIKVNTPFTEDDRKSMYLLLPQKIFNKSSVLMHITCVIKDQYVIVLPRLLSRERMEQSMMGSTIGRLL